MNDNFSLDEYHKSFKQFVEEFESESDRAAVILGAAKLDYVLYQILNKRLLPVVGRTDELLEGESPLSTFSAKINTCYRLGIIDAGFARALHLTRKIRNSFAHELSGCNLESGPHRDRVSELVAPFKYHPGFAVFKKNFVKQKSGTAADFLTILMLMISRLDGIFERIEPLDDAAARTLIAPAEKFTKGKNNK